jgi:hypothetical protein
LVATNRAGIRVRVHANCRFFKGAPDTSIFTEDVVFLDHIGPRIGMIFTSVKGRKAYSQHIWLLRFHSSIIFSRCEVQTRTSPDVMALRFCVPQWHFIDLYPIKEPSGACMCCMSPADTGPLFAIPRASDLPRCCCRDEV